MGIYPVISFPDIEDHHFFLNDLAGNALHGLPHFLFGQSMGGAVALKVHLKQSDKWDGLILVAPMVKVTC